MHIHSIVSFDGRMDFETIFTTARARGLGGVAICDHDRLAGSREAIAWRDAHPAFADFVVVPGCEYTTDYGHMLAYFIQTGAEEADVARVDEKLFSLAALSEFVHAQGGLLIAAHPLRHRTEIPAAILPLIDGVETHNARQIAYDGLCFDDRWTPFLALRHVTGGSDAHGRREVGNAYTVFAGTTLADVERELRAGTTTAKGRGTSLTLQALYKLRNTYKEPLWKRLVRVPVFFGKDIRRMFRKR